MYKSIDLTIDLKKVFGRTIDLTIAFTTFWRKIRPANLIKEFFWLHNGLDNYLDNFLEKIIDSTIAWTLKYL